MLLKIARKTQNMRFLRRKLNQIVIFCVQFFFEICFLKLIFSSKAWFVKTFFFKIKLFKNIFFLKIWRVAKFWIQNLTRCNFFNPKSDAFWNFEIKIWRFVKILFQNLRRLKILTQNPTSFISFSPKCDFILFSGSDCLMKSSVNVKTRFIWKKRIERQCVL